MRGHVAYRVDILIVIGCKFFQFPSLSLLHKWASDYHKYLQCITINFQLKMISR